VPSLNLKPNPHGGTAKKITSSPCKNFIEATQKKKIKQATKSKTSQLTSNVLLGPSDSDTDLAVPFADDSKEEDEEQDTDFVFCTGRFSEDHNGED